MAFKKGLKFAVFTPKPYPKKQISRNPYPIWLNMNLTE